jgi:hypothetical protein
VLGCGGMGFAPEVRGDSEALERRRVQATHLLAKGLSRSEVARQLRAHQESVRLG